MIMYYCCIEDIFEGIFDSRENYIEAIKERFDNIDWMEEKPILEKVVENQYNHNGIDIPIVDVIYVKWEGVDELINYNIIGYNINTTYSC